LRAGPASRLKLGLPPGLPDDLAPPLIGALREAEPDVRVELTELTTPQPGTTARRSSTSSSPCCRPRLSATRPATAAPRGARGGDHLQL
jgi:hypothetical protein